jgi:hypothetical protein
MSPTYEGRSQIEQLLADLAADGPDDRGVRRLLISQARKRLHDLEREAAADGSLHLRFIDSDDPTRHALRTNFLGTTLQEMQSSFNYMVWSTEAGPSVQGDVPTAVARRAATEVVAFDPGSFVVVLQKMELDMFDPLGQAMNLMLDLMNAAEESSFGEDVEGIVAALGTQASIRLQRVFGRLGRAGISLDAEWRGPESARSFLSDVQASALADWLGKANTEDEVVEVRGVLKMANYDSGRFKIVDPVTEREFEGRSDVDLAHVEIEAEYEASVLIVTDTSPTTGERRERMTLRAITRVH